MRKNAISPLIAEHTYSDGIIAAAVAFKLAVAAPIY